MDVMMVRAKVKEESVADVEAAVKTMFGAIDAAHPKGVKYASTRLPDGVTFVALLAVDDATENPLSAIPEVREFQEQVKGWHAETPVVESLAVIASYGLF